MPYKDKEVGRQKAKERRAKNAKEIDAKRRKVLRDRFNAMTDQEKEAFLANRRAKSLKSYYKHRDKIRAKAKANRVQTTLKIYGLNVESYNKILENQGGKCAICECKEFSKRWTSSNLPFVVDHCHETKKVRGLLCDACNVMIGHAYESVEILLNAIKYLKENGK